MDHEQKTSGGEQVEHDETFHEAAALDEIELFSELLIATGGRNAPLTRRELDALLGITA